MPDRAPDPGAPTPGQEWYAEYLKTPHWLATRRAKLASLDHLRCERCGEWGRRSIDGVVVGMQVHHLTYERVGKELLDDLQVLCVVCHEEQHGVPQHPRRREQVRRNITSSIMARSTAPDGYEDHIAEELSAVDALINEGADL